MQKTRKTEYGWIIGSMVFGIKCGCKYANEKKEIESLGGSYVVDFWNKCHNICTIKCDSNNKK